MSDIGKSAGQYAAMIVKQAWSRALAEARLATWIFGIVLAVALLVTSIDPDFRNRITLTVTVVALGAILVYRLCSVSYHSYAVLEAEVGDLNDKLADKIEHQRLADELTALHDRGKKLINPEGLQKDGAAWDAAIDAWIRDINEVMDRHGCSVQEKHHVDVQHADFVGAFEQFRGKARTVAVRTDRVADIATEHAKRASAIALTARMKNE